jgi:hypothetical protein
MSAAYLCHACPVCGAEESLDALLLRMIDDDEVRRLIAEVITTSLPLGGQVVQYLRLHKPQKHVLSITKVRKLLAELVPDIARGAITARGRDWVVSSETWRAAFAELFRARDRGTLDLPLQGNGYLYAVLMRMADSVEADAERTREHERRHGTYRVATQPAPITATAATQPPAASADASARRELPAWVRAAAEKLRVASSGVHVTQPPAAGPDSSTEV